MKNRIKVIYWLTIIAITSFVWMEGQWLRQRYEAAVVEQEKVVFEEVVGALDGYFAAQRRQNLRERMIYSMLYEQTDDGTRQTVQLIETDSAAWEMWNRMSDDEQKTLREAETLPEGFTRYGFDALVNCTADVQELCDRFLTLLSTGFNADSLRRICDVREARFVTGKEHIYEASRTTIGSLWQPQTKIVYPLSPLQKMTAEITADVPADKAVSEMALTLLVSFVVALLLIFCLVYQMATIRRQQKIAELQKNFTLTMLHELKRPLGALKLFISFMRNERLDVSDREAALANGAREIENLSSYFNKLRAITYNEASEIPLSLSAFNLKEAVEESVGMVDGAGVVLQGAGDVEIVAERQSIVNVLCNLVENAVKYSRTFDNLETLDNLETFENFEKPSHPIEISWQLLDGNLEISVADRGRGIPDADKPRIFEQFYRVAKSGDIPGMGLGLAYVRQVIEAHGGTIAVKDRDGGGTVFTINLPQ